jgi:hypothetical protein
MSETITRNPKLAWREIDGETVIISPEDSHVHELNETASLVWKHAEGQTLDQLAQRISAEYEVSRETARADLEELLAALGEKQLVFVAPDPKD